MVLGLNNLSVSTDLSFKTQATQIKTNLKTSLKDLLSLLHKFANLKTSSSKILNNFTFLKTYYTQLGNLLINFLPYYNKTILNTSYQKRLTFLSKVEEQTAKLLILVLIQRLNKIVKLKKFYKEIIVTPHFLCLETISLREGIQLISIKN